MNEHERWVLEWIKKADADLKTAEVILQSDEALYDMACFHCQHIASNVRRSISRPFLYIPGSRLPKRMTWKGC